MKKPKHRASVSPRHAAAPIQTRLHRAEQLFAQGRPRQALELAAQCLNRDPHNGDLLNFIGVCAIELGDPDSAERLWREAIALGQAGPQTHFNLGLLLAKSGQVAQAEHCYRRALALDPGYAEAHCNLGNLLADGSAAEACYRAALEIDPNFAAAHYNLGNLLLQRRAWEEAERCYRQASAADPADALTHAKLGQALANRRQLDEAERAYRRALALDPGCAEALVNLGLLLEDRQRPDEAEQCYRRALEISPDSPEIYSNLGNLLAQSGRTDEAEQCHRKAIRLAPTSAPACCNLGVLLASHKRDGEAEALFRQALAGNPAHALARLNLGQLLLAAGRWEEGWACHEARYAQDLPAPLAVLPAAARWQGQPLHGKALLVLSEQGFGDAIQFCRYLPLLKEQGAAHITLVCRPELKALFATLAGVDTLLDSEDSKRGIPRYDWWTMLMSLPFHGKTTLKNIPARIPYLHTPAERRARWSGRLPAAGLRVGLVWKGNPLHSNDARRSLPCLATLRPLWAVAGIDFVSLQKGQGEEEAAPPPADQPLVALGGELGDFADSAALIEQLDLVICVDSAVAHLAGALGKPCWLLLPDYQTDWRWLRERRDTPWYPTLRLFRQSARDDWAPLVAELVRALLETQNLASLPPAG